ncbi:probable E3 ubiquitin-protein ligase RNF144A [Neltuma alba]|uniref:probable E3 ubiquitin-protein ligase RNF144A n=1 Tax=Neltuma alba TaxID=207710 RepID=UPI0010A36699|nr:probable E3 ubiquitin-protein ligase RNF144A [Prosopis alba]
MRGGSSGSSAGNIFVDEFYFSVLFDEDDIFPISDEKYAEQIQLQEALMSSVIMSRTFRYDEDEINVINVEESSGKGKMKPEIGESSGSSSIMSFCGICMEDKAMENMFRDNKSCEHVFCSDCMASYVASKLKENISSMVKCPDPKCRSIIEPLFCRSIIPDELFERWENAVCENLILGSQKFYCPFKDCSAMLVDDGDEVVTSSECPNCRRLFCAQCKVTWHAGMDCTEFQSQKADQTHNDDLLKELAKNKRWRRCPRCRFFVEKIDGCSHISCRCGNQFCYGCGSDWNQHHGCRF